KLAFFGGFAMLDLNLRVNHSLKCNLYVILNCQILIFIAVISFKVFLLVFFILTLYYSKVKEKLKHDIPITVKHSKNISTTRNDLERRYRSTWYQASWPASSWSPTS